MVLVNGNMIIKNVSRQMCVPLENKCVFWCTDGVDSISDVGKSERFSEGSVFSGPYLYYSRVPL